LKYNTATVMRMTLSPEIAGYHTLTLQGQTSTYFYMLGVDAEQGVLTEAKQCPMLDSSITLVPWPEQNCFLTSFPNAEYRATEEFLQGNPDTWDRSQWVLQKAWWRPTGSPLDTYILEFEEIGPKGFNFSRFALNSSGTFIFWPEGRTGSDEHIEDDEGNDVVTGQNEPVYQIKACRVRQQEDGTLHFSDPFVAADVPHNMDTLEAVRTFDRYASFKVLSTELVESDQTITDDSGNVLPLYHAAKLWYTSVPNLQCATVVASCCTLPAVSAGGMAKFDVTIRNDGNSFLSGCHLQMFVHDVEIDENGKNRIVKDFGRCAAIVKFEQIYPLSYLEPSYVKKFKKDEDGTAKLVEYLKNAGVEMDFENADRKMLEKANIRVAIKRQLANEKKANKIIIKD
jgi:hypothetical protein